MNLKIIENFFCNGDYDKFKKTVIEKKFFTFAIIKDGKWYEKGEMGWFGCVSNIELSWFSKWNEILNDVDDESWLVVVDCHI